MIAADEHRRVLQVEVEELRREQNAASKEIGKAAPDERPAKIAAAGALKAALQAREADAERRPTPRYASWRSECRTRPIVDVPDGGEDDGEVVREVGHGSGVAAGAQSRRARRGVWALSRPSTRWR